MSEYTIAVPFREATRAQLEKALRSARKGEAACKKAGFYFGAWQRRREMLEREINRRPGIAVDGAE